MKLKGSAPTVLQAHPSLLHAAEVTDRVVRAITGTHAVVTALQEEGHSEGSRHYGISGDTRCRALDMRIAGIAPAQLENILKELKLRLPKEEFDVVLETTHVHIEADPK